MTEELTKLYKQNLTCSDSSIKAYVGNIIKLAKDMGKPLTIETFEDFEKVKQFIIDNNENLTTQKNKANSVNIYFKANKVDNKQYMEWMMKIGDDINDKQGANEKSPKEEDNWLSLEQLETLRKKLFMELPEVNKENPTYETLLKYQEYFMLCFHLAYPLRNDLATTRIGIEPFTKLTSNYIRVRPYLKEATMYLLEYKTASTYGKIQFAIDEPKAIQALLWYYDVLKKYTLLKGKQPLIINSGGQPITRNNYTKHFSAIFKSTDKNVSTTLIRKIVVSNVYDTKKIKELARIMAHSEEMALNVYAKDLD
jgi:hypothetical protein